MITREQIPVVLDHPVYDDHGNKIGEANHVFFDDITGEPEWVSVRTGLFGTKESFVPIHDATVAGDHLEVPYAKDQVKDAPNVDVDAGGHLSENEEHRLYEHYGIDWDTAWQQAGGPTTEAVSTGDDAMTRSEERMHVGVERRATGRARLRKYVVTEEVQQTVPVRHEEVVVEREPITEENRDEALSGPDIAEAEHEVTLHEERPVTTTETVPVERVRLGTEERVEEASVEGEVRKERIETEISGETGETGETGERDR
ncbi:DUF2382 domain-containing protein [Streptomyces djakartensis]|uniref:Photosystem reaction center subunit H n=1 Tax=Streptomyces djakartensis TaxID=68193 RepID=A0ABQ2ZMJ7_9ACTN|nr:PRC and DUF2382 domain-containing protein [Streptomyces djakartensis]GGY20593.1 hypothetical protein GCM10010384_29070 [Streptomyces djakartensis]